MSSSRDSSSSPKSQLAANVVDHWQLRTRTLKLGGKPLLMGIINVTPDSFSDGGQFIHQEDAVEQGLRLISEGADILDIGGESTRPYSEVVNVELESQRVLPVIRRLAETVDVPISIDTSKASLARDAIQMGAEIVNDVTALTGDAKMIEIVQKTGVGICAMHMQGTPQTMQDDPRYVEVGGEILDYLAQRRDVLEQSGINRQRICLDPGIGFGKTHQHNLTLLKNSWRFLELGCPVLVGHSRKGFIGKVLGDRNLNRTAGTVGVALALALQRIHILRVHDVGAVRQAMSLFEAAGGLAE